MFAAPQKSLMGKLPSISMNLAKTLPVRARGIPGKGMIKLAITGSIPQDYFGDHVNPNLWCKAKITYSNSSDTIFFPTEVLCIYTEQILQVLCITTPETRPKKEKKMTSQKQMLQGLDSTTADPKRGRKMRSKRAPIEQSSIEKAEYLRNRGRGDGCVE